MKFMIAETVESSWSEKEIVQEDFVWPYRFGCILALV